MLENANLTPAPSDAAGLNKFVDVIKNMCGVDLESKKEMIKQRLANFCQANGISSFENLSSKVVVDRTLRQEIERHRLKAAGARLAQAPVGHLETGGGDVVAHGAHRGPEVGDDVPEPGGEIGRAHV